MLAAAAARKSFFTMKTMLSAAASFDLGQGCFATHTLHEER